MENRLPKRLGIALAASFLLLVLSLCLLFYFHGEGRYGGVFRYPTPRISLSLNGEKIFQEGWEPTLSSGEHTLTLKNEEKEPVSFTFLSQGEKLESLTLAAGEEKEITLSLAKEGGLSLLLEGEKLALSYLSSGKDLAYALDTFSQGGDLVFFGNAVISEAHFSAPYRLFGAFSFEEVTFDTSLSGNLVISPAKAFEGKIYASALSCKIYFQNFDLSVPASSTDFYLKAISLNGRSLSLDSFPITSFEELERLAEPSLLPEMREGAILTVNAPFSMEDSLTLTGHLSLDLQNKITFGDHILTLTALSSGEYKITSQIGTAFSAANLDVVAPSSALSWTGLGSIPRFETAEKLWNLASYNGVVTTLGGEGNAVPSVTFQAAENEFLSEDVVFLPSGNQLIATVPYQVSADDLAGGVFHLSCEDGEARLEGDLKTGRVIATDDEGRVKRYSLGLIREKYNIPVIYIETEKDAPITSKSQYISATFQMDGEGTGIDSVSEIGIRIRGRGNSTWKWDKKPFKIHFDEPYSLLGLPEAEEWALFANYADKSLIRNRLAQVMASTLSFEYCPTQECVDLFLNGEYLGVYTLGEHLEEGEGRVEVTHDTARIDCGFFLEAGGVVAGVDVKGLNYFHAGLLKFVLIKNPDYETLTSEQFDYIMEYMQATDEAIKAGEGYENYIDVDSVIDWLIMIELANNTDCAWRRSTYFTKDPDGLLVMGPVWDFDLGFGNFSKDEAGFDIWVSSEPEDDYVGETWSTYLLEDPEFRARFKARWNEVKDTLLAVAMEEIDESYDRLSPSAKENFIRWDILGKKVAFERHDTKKYLTYESQIQYLRDFLTKRAAWIDEQVEAW